MEVPLSEATAHRLDKLVRHIERASLDLDRPSSSGVSDFEGELNDWFWEYHELTTAPFTTTQLRGRRSDRREVAVVTVAVDPPQRLKLIRWVPGNIKLVLPDNSYYRVKRNHRRFISTKA